MRLLSGTVDVDVSGAATFTDHAASTDGTYDAASSSYIVTWTGSTLGVLLRVTSSPEGAWNGFISVRHMLPTPAGKAPQYNTMFSAAADDAAGSAATGRCVVHVANASTGALSGRFSCNAVQLAPDALSPTPGPCACATLVVFRAAGGLVDAQGIFVASSTPLPRTGGELPVATGPKVASKASAPVGLIAGGVALALIVGLAFARRPLLALVGAGQGAQTKRDERRRESTHDACVARWRSAADLAKAARSHTARDLGETLAGIAGGFDQATAALDRAAHAFARLDHTSEPEPQPESDVDALIGRILRGIADLPEDTR